KLAQANQVWGKFTFLPLCITPSGGKRMAFWISELK
uniref:Uncharacterized protein n=1 Tax=Aegilops tauschii subsp. strangulata TaxID=200361 RepID=A0A453S638_AEGTS